MDIKQYLMTLPLMITANLPLGTLFWAENHLYEVVDVEPGYNKARQWRRTETSDVALVPGSTLAQRLRVVAEGRVLPNYTSRHNLLKQGQALWFVFPEEQNALDVAYLDTALCGRASGLYVRRHAQYPAFEITNGLNVMRVYCFMRTTFGIDTHLTDLKVRIPEALIPHREGPLHWRLVGSWSEAPYNLDQTVAMRPIFLAEIETQPHIQMNNDDIAANE